jgi:hypothetical protein
LIAKHLDGGCLRKSMRSEAKGKQKEEKVFHPGKKYFFVNVLLTLFTSSLNILLYPEVIVVKLALFRRFLPCGLVKIKVGQPCCFQAGFAGFVEVSSIFLLFFFFHFCFYLL